MWYAILISNNINIVWIKRDLRTQDHASFDAAEKNHLPYIPIYIFEPSILSHPDSSLRHQQFIFRSIEQVNLQLKKYNKIQTRLVRELEKKFSGRHVIVVGQRTILGKNYARSAKSKGPRPRSRHGAPPPPRNAASQHDPRRRRPGPACSSSVQC